MGSRVSGGRDSRRSRGRPSRSTTTMRRKINEYIEKSNFKAAANLITKHSFSETSIDEQVTFFIASINSFKRTIDKIEVDEIKYEISSSIENAQNYTKYKFDNKNIEIIENILIKNIINKNKTNLNGGDI